MEGELTAWRFPLRHILYRTSDRSRKKVNCREIFRDKFTEKSADFAGIFGVNFAEKQSGKKRQILWLFSGQI